MAEEWVKDCTINFGHPIKSDDNFYNVGQNIMIGLVKIINYI